MIVVDGLTGAVPTPLLARTVKVNVPAVVGVPDSTPVVAFNVNPLGSVPLATAKVGAGLPLAL